MRDSLLKLYIEPTSKCNLSCRMCFRNTWIDEAFADMDTATFGRAMDTMPDSVHTVFFGGMGEPLSHRDILYMVERAASKAANVSLLTNGTLLTPKMSSDLLDAGLDALWLSIDSFQSGGRAQGHAGFSAIKQNIAAFNMERAARESRAFLGVTFVAMKSNASELGALGHFAYENKVDKVNISNVIPTGPASLDECLYEKIIGLDMGTEHSSYLYPKIDIPYMDFKIDGVREGVTALLGTDCVLSIGGAPVRRNRRYCRFIEEGNAFGRWDGDVSPCMALLHSAATYLENNRRVVYHHSFGNLSASRLDDIWNSEEYSDFRARVKGFSFSPCVQCGGCENRDANLLDCLGNSRPTCGACLWSEGIIRCP